MQEEVKPVLSHANVVVNELICEYLEFNKYRHTLSVFTPGMPDLHTLDALKPDI